MFNNKKSSTGRPGAEMGHGFTGSCWNLAASRTACLTSQAGAVNLMLTADRHLKPALADAMGRRTMRPMLDPELIPLLRCPVTKQPLRPATDEEKQARQIPTAEPALITIDGSRVYRAEMDLPILLSAKEDGAALTG